jgi:hypothetical protein
LSPKVKERESEDCTPRFTEKSGKRHHPLQKKPAAPPKVQKKTLRATLELIESKILPAPMGVADLRKTHSMKL